MPPWVRETIWYHLYPLGFLGAEKVNPSPGASDGDVQHRLRNLEPWLDYLVDLGANGLLLGPVFESVAHGYETIDYYRVDRRLGDESDLVWLFGACHERGMRVLLDGVFNHVGRAFPAFQDVIQRREASPSKDLFRIDFGKPGHDGFAYETFEGHGELVALNHASDAVLDLTSGVANHWLARGADGFRLDAAYAVPVGFWKRFAERVRSSHPDAWLLGEVIHGDYVGFVTESTLDAVTQYELWKAIWSSINDANFFELAWALDRHQAFAASFLPYTFIGNHDVTRIASTLRDPRHLPHAVAILFTVPGTPSVYAGDEQGWQGVKEDRPGGDDEIRRPFPAQPSDLSADGQPTFRLYQELIALRRRHPWVADGTLKTLHVANRALAYQVTGQGGQRLLVALNLDDAPVSLDLPWRGGMQVFPRRLAGAIARATVAGDHLHLSALPPHAWTVLATGG